MTNQNGSGTGTGTWKTNKKSLFSTKQQQQQQKEKENHKKQQFSCAVRRFLCATIKYDYAFALRAFASHLFLSIWLSLPLLPRLPLYTLPIHAYSRAPNLFTAHFRKNYIYMVYIGTPYIIQTLFFLLFIFLVYSYFISLRHARVTLLLQNYMHFASGSHVACAFCEKRKTHLKFGFRHAKLAGCCECK